MAETSKILAQAKALQNGIEEILYVVPSGKRAICNKLFVCNHNASAKKFSLLLRPESETVTIDAHYLYRTESIPGSQAANIPMGITLGPGDTLYFMSETASHSFNLFGMEEDL